MSDILQTARALQTFCDARRWASCFIGGIAVLRWGEPRVTRDVDLTLLAGFGGEAPFIDALLSEFTARISEARSFALRHRVLLLASSDGIGMDISLGALAFEAASVNRATEFSFTRDIALRTCSAEDLIVLKLFASRPLDIHDAESVSLRNRGTLDWAYIEEQLTPLAEIKDDPAILAALRRLRAQ